MRLDWFQIDSGWFSDEEQPSNAPPSLEANRIFHLELSIHEICHYRVGPALWTYHGHSDKPDLDDLKSSRSGIYKKSSSGIVPTLQKSGIDNGKVGLIMGECD